MIENYTVTLEITPELEERAKVWASDEGGYTPELAAVGKAILDATPKPPDLLKQAFAIVRPSFKEGRWFSPISAIRDMAGWIAEHHNGRSHGYRLWAGKWYPWFQRTIYSNPFDSQQEAMAWLVVEMHRRWVKAHS